VSADRRSRAKKLLFKIFFFDIFILSDFSCFSCLTTALKKRKVLRFVFKNHPMKIGDAVLLLGGA